MNDIPPAAPGRHYSPLFQLVLARLREFYREPEAVFWVYGFPIVMMVALGLAFRNKPAEQVRVDVVAGPRAEAVVAGLEPARFVVSVHDRPECRLRLRTGRSDLVVVPEEGEGAGYEYLLVPTRPESNLARAAVDDALQRHAGRRDAVAVRDDPVVEPGGRYIDFLVPGLLGMGLMGGGLWGLGFVTVDLRLRKLLKRFLATPMRKADFLGALLISRLVFMVPEVLTLLLFAWLAFGVNVAGSLWAVLVLILLGAFAFAGVGLLVASRAQTMEAVSGLMNLVMLPMWVLSGIFFSPDRFPDFLQGFIRVIPLTPLIKALRAVMLEGATLGSQWQEAGLLAAWGVVSFVVALRIFRWN